MAKILLDVPLEDLKDILSDRGWDVSTVTEKLGPTKENRADGNILKYAHETDSIVITVDGPFVSRLRAAGIGVVAIDSEDKAKIIHEKLRQKILIDAGKTDLSDQEIFEYFNETKSGEPSRMGRGK